jgi:hypothetical protein
MAKRRRPASPPKGPRHAAEGSPLRGTDGERRRPTRSPDRSAGRRRNAARAARPPDIWILDLAGSARAVLWLAAAAGIPALVLYVLTLAPSVVGGDGGELMAAARVLGVAHPPGYPTFTVLTHVFGLLPLGSPAVGMNLLSAALDAACVAIVAVGAVLVAGRIGTMAVTRAERTVVLGGAALGAGLLAVSTAFWTWSLSAEVFALNNLFAAAILVLVLAWHRDPTRRGLLRAAAFLTGLSLTNQQTIVLLAPGLLVLYADGLRRLSALPGPARGGLVARDVLAPVAFVLVGLIPVVYLPIAAGGDPAVNWGDPRTLDRLVAVVSRQSYGTFSLTVRDASGTVVDQLIQLGGSLLGALTPIGLGLGLVGWIALARVSGVLATAFALLVLVSGPLFVAIANPPLDDPVTRGVLERFAILPTVVIAILAGVGAIRLGQWALVRAADEPVRTRLAAGLGIAALALIVAVGALHVPIASQRDNRVAEAYGRDILEPLPADVLLLMRSDEHYTTVTFAQVVEVLRPDVVAIDVELLKLPTYVAQLRRQHPAIQIPFAAYDDGATTSLGDVVAANLPSRPVFVVGRLKEDLSARYATIPWGLTRRFVPVAGAPSAADAARADAERLAGLHPPATALPDTTWEGVMAANYGSAAFEDAHARQVGGPQPDWQELADLYRQATRLAPTLWSADKNLGLLLLDNGGSPAEIVTVWRRYLAAVPDDPDAAAIRSQVERLAATP